MSDVPTRARRIAGLCCAVLLALLGGLGGAGTNPAGATPKQSSIPIESPSRADPTAVQARAGSATGLFSPEAISRRAEPAAATPTRLAPIDLACVIDDSGSEAQTDPFGERYKACEFAAELLAGIASPTLDHRVAVVHFGTTAPPQFILPLTPVRTGLDQVRAALAHPLQLGDTNYAGALQSTRDLLGPPSPDRRQLTLVFGDGAPDLPGRSVTSLFSDIQGAIAGLPSGSVFVFGLDVTGAFTAELPNWQRTGAANVQALSSIEPGTLERAYRDLILRTLGVQGGVEYHLSAAGDAVAVTVAPYQEALALTFLAPTPDAVLSIEDPSGRIVGRAGPGRVGLLSLRLPHPGQWHIRLVAGRDVATEIDVVPLEARLAEPLGTAPLQRPLVVEATFLTSWGTALPELPAAPRYFGAQVVDPRGGVQSVQLAAIGAGRYRAVRGIVPAIPGQYQVRLVMKGASSTILDQQVASLSVADTPYVVPLTHAIQSRNPLQLPLAFRITGRNTAAQPALADDPNSAVVIRVAKEGDSHEAVFRAKFQGGSRFVAQTSYTPADGERDRVIVELNTTTADGHAISDRTTYHFTAEPTAWMIWSDRLHAMGLGALALALATAIAYSAWLLTRRPMNRRLLYEGSVHTARGRRFLRIGGNWPRQPVQWFWETRNGPVRREGRIPLPWGTHPSVTPAVTVRPTRAQRWVHSV